MEGTAQRIKMNTNFKSIRSAVIYTGLKFDKNFSLDDPERELMYRRAFHCLCGSDQAEELGMNPNKGILQIGNKGVGKSIMMRVMQVLFKNTPRRFKWVDVFTIADMLKSKVFTEMDVKDMYGRGLKCDLYIDDVGFGNPNVAVFKNEVNIIAEILYERDELQVMEGFHTHMSSNIPTSIPKDADADLRSLERLYGDRIMDRIVQMTNLLVWTRKESLRR